MKLIYLYLNIEIEMVSTQCIKVAALRKQFGQDIDLEQWMKMENNLYVGRRGRIFIGSGDDKRIFHYSESKWKNPFKEFVLDENVRKYEELIRSSELINQLDELKGKTLGCFCDQQGLCHAKVLQKLYYEKYPTN